MRECPHCGTAATVESRFCAECGRPLPAPGAAGLPAEAWRIWPPDPLVLIAVLVALGGLILFVGGLWAWGLVAILAAAVLFLARTHLGVRPARAAVADFGARAAATREAMAARSRGQVGVFRARRELAELEADRSRLFRDLGVAAYEDDEIGVRAARTAVDAVNKRIADKKAEVEMLVLVTEERVERARAHVRPTEKIESRSAPARVPDPWPPPDEGELPGPPTPSPGEPTPGPEEPAPPRHPPMRQTRSPAER